MAADDRVDALFAGPAEDFVAARDALVKQVRAEGDKERAAEVKALRRPTVAAWAVNQVARASKKDVAQLVAIGDRLRDAHDALLEGKGDAGIREATAERRTLVAKLTKQAVGLLGAGADAQTEAITHTFDAAVADPEAGMAVRAGRLSKELEAPSGFGGGLVFGSSEPAAPRARKAGRPTGGRPRRDGTDSEAAAPPGAEVAAAEAERVDAERAAEEAAEEAERRRRELEREAEACTAEAEAAAREAVTAREEVDRLRDLLATAEDRAQAAEEQANVARERADAAQRALRDASTSE